MVLVSAAIGALELSEQTSLLHLARCTFDFFVSLVWGEKTEETKISTETDKKGVDTKHTEKGGTH